MRPRNRGQKASGLEPMLSNGLMLRVNTVAAALGSADIRKNAGRWTKRFRFHVSSTSENLRASQTIAGVSGAHASHVRIPHEKTRDAAWFIPSARTSR